MSRTYFYIGVGLVGALTALAFAVLLFFTISAPESGLRCAAILCVNQTYIGYNESEYPNDAILRLNHAQVLHAHNSCHKRPSPLWAPAFDYEWPELDALLTDYGPRAIELDVNDNMGLTVFHLPFFDSVSTCFCLEECLARIRNWSDAHPSHFPLLVHLDFREEFGVSHFDERTFAHLETAFSDAFCDGRLIHVNEMRHDRATLKSGVNHYGWPALETLRGRILVYMKHDDDYVGDIFFQMVSIDERDDHDAVFVEASDPIAQCADIRNASADGYIVQTRIYELIQHHRFTNTTIAEVMACGPHIISSSTLAPRAGLESPPPIINLAGTHIACNPITAIDVGCTSELLEHSIFPGYA